MYNIFTLFYLIGSVAKLRSETKKEGKEAIQKKQLQQHNIRDCKVNLGVRVTAPQDGRSMRFGTQPLAEISMAQFNQEILLKSR